MRFYMLKRKTKKVTKKQIAKEKLSAKLTLNASYNAAAAMIPYARIFGEQNVSELTLELMEICDNELKGNNLKHSEEMLLNQAHTLQTIFTNLSRQAFYAEQIDYSERYLRLALKAQAQSVRALEVLGAIRNPGSVAFVKQANIGQAVQVNNGIAPPEPYSRARENKNSTNELLEIKDEQRLDIRETSTPKQINTHMETVEEIDRSKNNRR